MVNAVSSPTSPPPRNNNRAGDLSLVDELKAALPHNDAAEELAKLARHFDKRVALGAVNALKNCASWSAGSILKQVIFEESRPLEVRVAAIEVLGSSRVQASAFRDDLQLVVSSCAIEGDKEEYQFSRNLRVAAYVCLPQSQRPRIDSELQQIIISRRELDPVVCDLVERRASAGRRDWRQFATTIHDKHTVQLDQLGLIAQSIATLSAASTGVVLEERLRALDALKSTQDEKAFCAIATIFGESSESPSRYRNPRLRLAAVSALWECAQAQGREKQGAEILSKVLCNSHELRDVRSAALAPLVSSWRGVPFVVDFLGNLEQERGPIRQELEAQASIAIQEKLRKNPRTVRSYENKLLQAAGDENLPTHSRAAALRALGNCGVVAYPSAAARFLSAQFPQEIREAVLLGLKGCKRMTDLRHLFAFACNCLEPKTLRLTAIDGLAVAANSGATAALIEIIANRNDDSEIRKAAACAIGPNAARHLMKRLPEFRDDPIVGARICEILDLAAKSRGPTLTVGIKAAVQKVVNLRAGEL